MKGLHDVFKTMKNHKSTSQDPIPIEIYKYLNSKIPSKEILHIILECWNTAEVPDIFLEVIVLNLQKGKKIYAQINKASA